jgi:hypothetical protein
VAGVTGTKVPNLFTTVYMHAQPKTQCWPQCIGPGLQEVSGTIGPGLFRILQVGFREFTFYALR